MKTLDLEGLPEPVAQALERVVLALRDQFHADCEPIRVKMTQSELPILPGTVIGALTRKEIYENAD